MPPALADTTNANATDVAETWQDRLPGFVVTEFTLNHECFRDIAIPTLAAELKAHKFSPPTDQEEFKNVLRYPFSMVYEAAQKTLPPRETDDIAISDTARLFHIADSIITELLRTEFRLVWEELLENHKAESVWTVYTANRDQAKEAFAHLGPPGSFGTHLVECLIKRIGDGSK